MQLEDAFREYQRSVYAYFLRTVGDAHLAEELTQETFFRACTGIFRFRGDASAKTWLFGIARRVLLEASRKGAFRDSTDPEASQLAGVEPDTDLRLDLERAFLTLSLEDRETLILVDLLGFKPQEAATLTNISPATFRMRLHRARGRLRVHMEVAT